MIICDTSIWIEYFKHRDPIFEIVSSLLEGREILGLECIFKLQNKGIGLIDSAIAIATFKSNSKLWTLDKKLLSIIPGKYKYSI